MCWSGEIGVFLRSCMVHGSWFMNKGHTLTGSPHYFMIVLVLVIVIVQEVWADVV